MRMRFSIHWHTSAFSVIDVGYNLRGIDDNTGMRTSIVRRHDFSDSLVWNSKVRKSNVARRKLLVDTGFPINFWERKYNLKKQSHTVITILPIVAKDWNGESASGHKADLSRPTLFTYISVQSNSWSPSSSGRSCGLSPSSRRSLPCLFSLPLCLFDAPGPLLLTVDKIDVGG